MFADLGRSLSEPAVYVPLLSAASGWVIANLKRFLITDQEMSRRVDLDRKAVLEKVAQSYQRLLEASLTLPSAQDLRGCPPRETDIIKDHAVELFQSFEVVARVDAIGRGVSACYTALFLTVGLGLIGFVGGLLFPGARVALAVATAALVVIQIVFACRIRRLEAKEKGLIGVSWNRVKTGDSR